MYMISVMTFFAIGGTFAMLIRLELFSHGKTIIDAPTYNQVMTFHGAVMVFMVIIPGIPAFFGNFILPMQFGAKDVAFPGVNLISWYCLMVGAIVAFSHCSLMASTRAGPFTRPIPSHRRTARRLLCWAPLSLAFRPF